jgi:hypothetical protein
MSALTHSTFWLAILTVAGIGIVTATVVVLLRRLTLELLHRLEANSSRAVAARRGLRPDLWNPVFWLTWLAIMTAIMLCGIVGGVLARTALALGLVRLRKALAREGR